MGFITANRAQQNFIGYSIEDFAKSDNKSRFVTKIVSQLDLDSLYDRYSDQGGDAYAPNMMFALWFYAYSKGITSSRKLEELCLYDTRYIYLSCNLHPDHTTLSRFRQHHLDLLVDFFVQIILLAEKAGYAGFNHISIDGTKIKASCSAKQSHKNDQLGRKIAAIRQDIQDYMQRCAFVEQGATDELNLEILRAEKARLEELEKKLVERQRQLEERQKTLKAEHRKDHQINIVEPEARFMPKADGPSYNAQAAVDCETRLIVTAEVTDAPNDQNQFELMHQKTESNLPHDPKRQYTADSGFHSVKQLKYIAEHKIDALIADPTPNHRSNDSTPTPARKIIEEQRKVERSDFTYHTAEDYYQCPNGDKLIPIYQQDNNHVTVYQASKCGSCPLAKQCIFNKSQLKRIHRNCQEELAENMNRKLHIPTGRDKARMKIRATTIEPVFGNAD